MKPSARYCLKPKLIIVLLLPLILLISSPVSLAEEKPRLGGPSSLEELRSILEKGDGDFLSSIDGYLAADQPHLALMILGYQGGSLKLGRKVLAQILKRPRHDESMQLLFGDSKVMQYLEHVSASDSTALAGVTAIYSDLVLSFIAENRVVEASRCYDLVISLRHDPSPANDALRFRIALSAEGEEARDFARARIYELNRREMLGFKHKAALLIHGYYGNKYLIIFACSSVIFLLIVGVISVLKMPSKSLLKNRDFEGDTYQTRESGVSARSAKEQPSNTAKKKQKDTKGYLRMAEGLDEYSRLLSVFGLNDSADEEDIRRAYRECMKELHPDSGAPQTPETVKRFEELKQTYERLNEILSSRFGGGR